MLIEIKREIKMAKQKCQKCGKTWHGWAQPDICPDCGGKLEEAKDKKKIEKLLVKFQKWTI